MPRVEGGGSDLESSIDAAIQAVRYEVEGAAAAAGDRLGVDFALHHRVTPSV